MHFQKTLFGAVLISVLILLSSTTAHAQQRKKQLQWEGRIGVGLLPTFLKDHAKTEVQPISMELRFRPTQRFSLGLMAGTSVSQAYQTHHTGESRLVRNSFQMYALRAAIHTAAYEKWEIYGGTAFGYTFLLRD